jgi:hypothetical protein
VTTTKIDIPPPYKKDLEREKIAEDIKKYLAKGGTITQCPRNAFTTVDPDGKPVKKKKFDGGRNASLTSPDKITLGGFVPKKGKD